MRVWVEKRFFRAPYEFKHVVSSFSQLTHTTIDTRALVNVLLDHIDGALHPGYVAVLLPRGPSRLEVAAAPGPAGASRGELPAGIEHLPAEHPLWLGVAVAPGLV